MEELYGELKEEKRVVEDKFDSAVEEIKRGNEIILKAQDEYRNMKVTEHPTFSPSIIDRLWFLRLNCEAKLKLSPPWKRLLRRRNQQHPPCGNK